MPDGTRPRPAPRKAAKGANDAERRFVRPPTRPSRSPVRTQPAPAPGLDIRTTYVLGSDHAYGVRKTVKRPRNGRDARRSPVSAGMAATPRRNRRAAGKIGRGPGKIGGSLVHP